jgi:curved DNA-binding protein
MHYKDYYAALGLPRDADLDQIKKAYRKLARKHHPDMSKDKDAEARFKDVGEAYATLKDPEKRAAYDALGQQPAGAEFSPPPQWRSQYGAGAADFGGMGDLDHMDLADLLAAMGRQQGAHRATGPQPGCACAARAARAAKVVPMATSTCTSPFGRTPCSAATSATCFLT